MTSRFVLGLIFFLSRILFGCSITAPTAGTKTFDYIKVKASSIEDCVLTGLGHGFSIRAEAKSWRALVQEVKPTFTWNGRDMMSIEYDANGLPRFVLDEAYMYQPTNELRRWILVKDERRSADRDLWSMEDWWRQFSTFNLPAVAELRDSTPQPSDGGGYGPYAVVKSKHPRFGEVYEIGWEREMGIGTAHQIYNRRLYLYRDSLKQWHFLGEGPEEGWSRGGGAAITTQVLWKKVKAPGLPLEIRFVSQEILSVPPSQAEDQARAADLTFYREFILSPPFPCPLRETTKRAYLVSEKNDTLDKIAERLGYWQPGWACDNEKSEVILKKQVLEMWIAELARLNPQLPNVGQIKEGTRIQILTYAETLDRMGAVRKEAVK